MTPDNVYDWAKAIGILGAILFGGFAVFSPSWVWFRRNLFGWGGAILCGFGTVLLVSPIFRNIHFVVDTNKLELKLSELESQLGQVRASVAALTMNLDTRGTVTTASVDDLNAKLQGIEKSIANVDRIGASVAALMTNLDSRGTVTTTSVDELNARLRGIERSVAGFETAISTVSSLGDKIKGVEKAAAEIDKSSKALNMMYLAGSSPPYTTSNYEWWDLYQTPKKIHGVQNMKIGPFVTAKYPTMTTDIFFFPPNKETLPEYERFMQALVNVPEYQKYLEALRKTDPGLAKAGWIFPNSARGPPKE